MQPEHVMECNEVSIHEVRAYLALTNSKDWMTSAEWAKQADIAPRTARAFAVKFINLGIAERAEVFPAHRYMIARKADKRNAGYLLRLKQAANVFGLQ
jgi:hypothetical protein